MPCGTKRKKGTKRKRRDKPTYKTREQALRHGHIQYGETKSGARKFTVYKVKGGWNVSKKKVRKR